MKHLSAILSIALLAGCGSSTSPLETYGSPSTSMSIVVGQELRVTMRTIGPGEYVSPPALTGAAALFRGVALADAQVPAGVTQVFTFRGVSAGQTLVVFHNTGVQADVIDTIVVH